MSLNQEQNDAMNKIVTFLTTDEPAIIIDGSGGTGKSYLINELKKNLLKEYRDLCSIFGLPVKYNNIRITSTTNKACESLGLLVHEDVPTIHSFLGLRVTEDYKTGEEKLATTDKASIIFNEVIIIDEASMINWELFKYIQQFCSTCKIIYVGDKYQLAPVKETISQVYKQNYQEIPLKTFMRQQNQALTDLAQRCKDAIDNKTITINTVKDTIEVLTKENTFTYLNNNFIQPQNNNKICCYTNNCCIAYNSYIHSDVRGHTEPFYKGQRLIANNVLHGKDGMLILHTEDVVDLIDVEPMQEELEITGKETNIKFPIVRAQGLCLTNGNTVSLILPVNSLDKRQALKILAKDKDWTHYYQLKDYVADLRYADACTVHKAQGATVDTVLIDLDNLSTCRNPDTFYRLLYVACTRARHKVYFYGSLAKKFGSIL